MEAIAIIGMGGRFPGAPNLRAFWQLICKGGDAITEVPADRYNVDLVYDPRPGTPGKVMSRWGGFLDQIDQFDAAFFGLSPREASRMDPQHRLLLEVAWEAMEDAGLVPEQLSDEIAGVFIGIITGDYWDRQFRDPADLDVYSTAGSARSGAAGRISYALGLQGVSVALDAACSSSLVAVHLACQSLRTGSCTIALAGGVNVILNPDHTIGFSQGHMMAPDGHCKAFDARADGYVRSEGAGVVVLKPLARALADGDPIHAVIRGSAANNDGRCALFMAPSVSGQQAALRQAYQNAGLDPLHVDYVEAHGTGTRVGDPVELKALGSVLCAERSPDRPLIVGSVKTNIGHTEGAAGLAGLIKTALCLKHKVIPPNLHFHEPNPAIPWQDYPLVIPTSLTSWPDSDHSCYAGVSSFGIAGTNAHIVLEEAPPANKQNPDPEYIPSSAYLLPLSAQTANGLKELAYNYVTHLEDAEYADQTLHDICYTASLRRTHHDYRLAIIGCTRQEIRDKLAAFLGNEMAFAASSMCRATNRQHKIVWIFPGQGSQWVGMGRDLLKQEPVFRAAIEACDRIMRNYVEWSLINELLADEERSRLHEIDVVQPVLFAIEVALAALWRSWGIEPDAVVGHSMGEVAAAYVAGALSLDDAAWIICTRSKLLLRVSGKGSMAAVALSLEQARLVVNNYKDLVSVAVNNSPASTVLSGDPTALAEILAKLEQDGVFGHLIKVDVASHSPQMEPLQNDLLLLMQSVQARQERTAIYSTVTGELIDGSALDARYWVSNLCQPVLFLSATQKLLEDHFDIFMEMSPHPLLVGAVRQTIEQEGACGSVQASLRRDEDGRAALLTTLGNLYLQGCKINWSGLYPVGGRHVSLPGYPWQRQRCWNASVDRPYAPAITSSPVLRDDSAICHPILGRSCTPLALQPEMFFWTITIAPEIFPYLSEHCVYNLPVLPCAAYIELALAAAMAAFESPCFCVDNLDLKKALFFPKGMTQTLQVILTPDGAEEESMRLYFFSTPMGRDGKATSWILHAQATVRRADGLRTRDKVAHPSLRQALDGWELVMEAPEHYQRLRARGIQHGPLFQGITHVWRRFDEVMCDMTIPTALVSDMGNYYVHPALLDAFLQGITPFLSIEDEQETYVPIAVKQIKFYQSPIPCDRLHTHAIVRSKSSGNLGTLEGDIILFNEAGQVLIEVAGVLLQSLERGAHDYLRQRINQLLYKSKWEQQAYGEQRRKGISRKSWLIFGDDNGIGHGLASHLRATGANCVIVTPGQSYKQVDAHHYEVAPAAHEEFYRLLRESLDEEGKAAIGIVYLWAMLIPPVNEEGTQQICSVDQDLSGIGVLHLIQALAMVKREANTRLWLVTKGVHAIEAQDGITALAQAPLWGLGRVIVYEHQNLHCTLIDLDAAPPEEQSRALFKEICSDDEADEVALRGERRYVARLARYTLSPRSGQEATLFHADATYLITGGLGGVGLRTAQWMIEQGARHLVLMGRHEAIGEAEAMLQTLRQRGAIVSVMLVDVSQKAQLAEALTRIRREMPPLRGVFHSAVVLDDSILLQLNRARFLQVMLPKVEGAWNLHCLTREDPLDYFVLFSSAASLIGSPGQGNYAAANAFLDILAHYRRQRGYPALCINWGRWDEVGQAMKEKRGERLDIRGFTSIKPKEGLAVLASLLGQECPQVGVMAFHLGKWSQFYPQLIRSSLFVQLLEETGAEDGNEDGRGLLTRETLTELDDEQRQWMLSRYLGQQIARVLGHTSAKLDPQQQLNRLGIDSLTCVELKNRIGSDLNVFVPVTTFLQGITFEQLTQRINHLLHESLS
ncbi:MAG TPA: type I polyketide synthase [Ktedonobacteraceae bacterium]|nr:type I polyketide synthase [Ktedonobacteraceae bacterium]